MPPVNRDLIKDRRDELDLSNRQLAESASISALYLDNILCGADEPSQRLIYRLERVLGLSKGALTAGDRTPRGDPSEPPQQPTNEPTHPPTRQEQEQDKSSPPRVDNTAAVA